MRDDKVRDHKGNELRLIILQILERDKDGQPTVCRVRYAHEKIDVTEGPDGQAVFLLVWSATDMMQQAAQIAAAQQILEAYEVEIKDKTDALRALAAATRTLETKLRDEQVKNGNLEREVAELKASKRKLREALDRTKESR